MEQGQVSASLTAAFGQSSAARLASWLSPLLAVAGLLLYAFTRTANYNGDGLVYALAIKDAHSANLISPGHLLYGPLNLKLYQLLQALGLGLSPLAVLQWGNIIVGALSLGLMAAIAVQLLPSRRLALLVAVGFGVSYSFWIQATDAEAYASAIMCTLAATLLLVLAKKYPHRQGRYCLAAGALGGLAILFHISMVLFYPAALIGLLFGYKETSSHRLRRVALYSMAFLLAGFAPLLITAFTLGNATSFAGALAWLGKSSHSASVSLGPKSFIQAGYGVVNSFVFLASLGQEIQFALADNSAKSAIASQLMRSQTAPLLSYLTVALLLGVVGWLALRRLHLREGSAYLIFLIGWIVPFALMGIYYFPSDTERWVIILPAVWLLIGLAVAAAPANKFSRDISVLAVAVILLALVNGIGAIIPARNIRQNALYTVVQSIDRSIGEHDLVIIAGRAWNCDLYLDYFHNQRNHFSLAAATMYTPIDMAALMQSLNDQISQAEKRGAALWLYGDLRSAGQEEQVWQRATHINISREDFLTALGGFTVEQAVAVGPDEKLYRLKRNTAPTRPLELQKTTQPITYFPG